MAWYDLPFPLNLFNPLLKEASKKLKGLYVLYQTIINVWNTNQVTEQPSMWRGRKLFEFIVTQRLRIIPWIVVIIA